MGVKRAYIIIIIVKPRDIAVQWKRRRVGRILTVGGVLMVTESIEWINRIRGVGRSERDSGEGAARKLIHHARHFFYRKIGCSRRSRRLRVDHQRRRRAAMAAAGDTLAAATGTTSTLRRRPMRDHQGRATGLFHDGFGF